jgi:hypothetical protein
MQQTSAARSTKFVPTSLATQVRDSLAIDEKVIVECVNEVLAGMPAHQAEVFRHLLKSSPSFGASVKRVTVDVGVVLSLAKSFESDDAFADSAGLIHDIEFSGHGGRVGAYAKAMVESDLRFVEGIQKGEVSDEAMLYDMVAPDVLQRRLILLSAFMDEALKRSK